MHEIFSNQKKVCYFTNESIVDLEFGTSNNRYAVYLLNAFFNNESASMYKIDRNNIEVLSDDISTSDKIENKTFDGDGVVLRGNIKELVSFHNYLNLLAVSTLLNS